MPRLLESLARNTLGRRVIQKLGRSSVSRMLGAHSIQKGYRDGAEPFVWRGVQRRAAQPDKASTIEILMQMRERLSDEPPGDEVPALEAQVPSYVQPDKSAFRQGSNPVSRAGPADVAVKGTARQLMRRTAVEIPPAILRSPSEPPAVTLPLPAPGLEEREALSPSALIQASMDEPLPTPDPAGPGVPEDTAAPYVDPEITDLVSTGPEQAAPGLRSSTRPAVSPLERSFDASPVVAPTSEALAAGNRDAGLVAGDIDTGTISSDVASAALDSEIEGVEANPTPVPETILKDSRTWQGVEPSRSDTTNPAVQTQAPEAKTVEVSPANSQIPQSGAGTREVSADVQRQGQLTAPTSSEPSNAGAVPLVTTPTPTEHHHPSSNTPGLESPIAGDSKSSPDPVSIRHSPVQLSPLDAGPVEKAAEPDRALPFQNTVESIRSSTADDASSIRPTVSGHGTVLLSAPSPGTVHRRLASHVPLTRGERVQRRREVSARAASGPQIRMGRMPQVYPVTDTFDSLPGAGNPLTETEQEYSALDETRLGPTGTQLGMDTVSTSRDDNPDLLLPVRSQSETGIQRSREATRDRPKTRPVIREQEPSSDRRAVRSTTSAPTEQVEIRAEYNAKPFDDAVAVQLSPALLPDVSDLAPIAESPAAPAEEQARTSRTSNSVEQGGRIERAAPLDLDDMAAQVYEMLSYRLRVEHERARGWEG